MWSLGCDLRGNNQASVSHLQKRNKESCAGCLYIWDNVYKSLSADQITHIKTVLISIILLLWPIKIIAFVSYSYRSKWMESFLKTYPKEISPRCNFEHTPNQFLLSGSCKGRRWLPYCWKLQLPRSLWPDIPLTESSFRAFLSKHKLALCKCNGARCLKAMLIRGNKMVFLLHLWPLTLTRSLKSWALAMGTNYRQRGSYGAVEVDAPGFKSSLCHLPGKCLVWWDWNGIPGAAERRVASSRATVGEVPWDTTSDTPSSDICGALAGPSHSSACLT